MQNIKIACHIGPNNKNIGHAPVNNSYITKLLQFLLLCDPETESRAFSFSAIRVKET